jgi:anti-sigma factor (TIGR02949 family)
VKCKEFQERISAAVDRCLPATETEAFDQHADRCPPCRREYEMEVATKHVLQRRAHMVAVPPRVQETILSAIRQDTASGDRAGGSWWLALQGRQFFKPLVALVMTALVVVVVVTREPSPPELLFPMATASIGPNDVIGQSHRNYHAVLSGDIKPQLLSSSAEDLHQFFDGKTEFPVVLPVVREWKLVGGVLNQHQGTTLAHVVYECDGQYVYLYQACWETVQKGEPLSLSADVSGEVARSGWSSRRGEDGDALVIWTCGRTLCVVVAHMQRDSLLRCLRSEVAGESAPR